MATNTPRFGTSGRQGENLGQAAQGAAGSVMESIREGAENLGSTVSSAAEQAWETTRQGAQQVGQFAESAWDSTNDFMRRYPLVTLGFGMCMGFTLCLAIQGGRRE